MKNKSDQTLYIHIDGIYCEHCIETITRALSRLEGVDNVSLRQNVAAISGPALPSAAVIVNTIRDAGYETDESKISTSRAKVIRKTEWYEFLLIAAVIILIALGLRYIFGYNIFNAIPAVDSSLSYGMLFVTGLLTSIHCISMCGAIGIYASSESNSVRSLRRPLLYNAGRVISYTVTGGIIGMAGSIFNIHMTLRGVMILIAAVFMILMALSMLGVLSFRLPRFITVRTGGKKLSSFVIGLLNGFMPCGPLQAMQIYALSTGSFWAGALSMLLFSLGTVPLMLLSGAALNLAKGKLRTLVSRIAPVLMMILALSMLNRGLLSFGVDLSKIFPSKYGDYISASMEGDLQTVDFSLEYDSYADIVVQKGVPVRITVHADPDKITGCNNAIVSRTFSFAVTLSPGENIIEFTPQEEGDYTYSCWMHMITNHIKVVDDPGYFK